MTHVELFFRSPRDGEELFRCVGQDEGTGSLVGIVPHPQEGDGVGLDYRCGSSCGLGYAKSGGRSVRNVQSVDGGEPVLVAGDGRSFAVGLQRGSVLVDDQGVSGVEERRRYERGVAHFRLGARGWRVVSLRSRQRCHTRPVRRADGLDAHEHVARLRVDVERVCGRAQSDFDVFVPSHGVRVRTQRSPHGGARVRMDGEAALLEDERLCATCRIDDTHAAGGPNRVVCGRVDGRVRCHVILNVVCASHNDVEGIGVCVEERGGIDHQSRNNGGAETRIPARRKPREPPRGPEWDGDHGRRRCVRKVRTRHVHDVGERQLVLRDEPRCVRCWTSTELRRGCVFPSIVRCPMFVRDGARGRTVDREHSGPRANQPMSLSRQKRPRYLLDPVRAVIVIASPAIAPFDPIGRRAAAQEHRAAV